MVGVDHSSSQGVVAHMLHATENYLVKVYHSIILNSMRVKAVLIVLGQLSNIHLLEVC